MPGDSIHFSIFGSSEKNGNDNNNRGRKFERDLQVSCHIGIQKLNRIKKRVSDSRKHKEENPPSLQGWSSAEDMNTF